MNPTPYPDVNALLDVVLAGIRETLGPKLVGLYLFGSLVTGAFDRDISDVDLIAALAADLDEVEGARLEQMHARIARGHPRWADRIEVGYLAVATLGEFAPHRRMGRISPGEPFHLTEAGAGWLFNLFVLRESGLALLGPPPAALVGPIAPAALVRALPGLMREWREWIEQTELIHQRRSQAYMIITMCRCLYTLDHRAVASKRQAARWAERAWPEWSSLIRDAVAWREITDDEGIDHAATLPETLRFVHFAIDAILSA